jgi:hypothetical protein
VVEDLTTYFIDTPYRITVAGVTKICLFVEGDEVTLQQSGMGQIAAQAVVTVLTSDFPAIKGNAACVITTIAPDGSTSTSNFTVWRRIRIQDGALTELLLKAA